MSRTTETIEILHCDQCKCKILDKEKMVIVESGEDNQSSSISFQNREIFLGNLEFCSKECFYSFCFGIKND